MNFFSALFYFRDKKTPDKLGLYPQRFHINAIPERRYLWTSRILVIFTVLSFCLTIMLTMVLYLLVPQKNAIPRFYREDSNTYTLEEITKATQNVYFKDLLTEKYIFDYVQMRHAIPRSTADLFYRWDTDSKFYWFSSIRNYSDFINKLDNKKLREFIRMDMNREIQIDNIKKLSRDFWMVDFRTLTTTRDMPEPDIILWRAYLRVAYMEFKGYEKLEKKEEEKENYTTNPFGFKVMQYSLAYVGKPEKAENYLNVAKKVFENLEDVVK